MKRALLILLSGGAVSSGLLAWRSSMDRLHAGMTPTRDQVTTPVELFASADARPLCIGDRIPDATLVDQNAKPLRISDLRGEVLVLTFIYTGCRVSTMCPMVSSRLVRVHESLLERGVRGVRFLMISFDNQRDDAESLQRFAATLGTDPSRFILASGAEGQVRELSRSFHTYYQEIRPGVFNHNIVVSLIDADGVLRADFFGTQWSIDELGSAIEGLSRERIGGRSTPASADDVNQERTNDGKVH